MKQEVTHAHAEELEKHLANTLIPERFDGREDLIQSIQAYHRSCCSRETAKVATTLTHMHYGCMTSEQWLAWLHMRILLPNRKPDGANVSTCTACLQATHVPNRVFEHWFSHAVGCTHVKLFKARHDAVKKLLHKLLSSRHVSKFRGQQVSMEVPLNARPGKALVTDISTQRGPNDYTCHWDIVVCDPAAPTYLEKGSANTALVATQTVEEAKIRNFVDCMPVGTDSRILIPFAVESTGRLGLRARQSLLDLKIDPVVFRRFISSLSLIMARFTALMALRAIHGIDPVNFNDSNTPAGVTAPVPQWMTDSLSHF
jgi:hypothetical protein